MVKFTAEQRKAIIRERQRGLSIKKLAAIFHCTTVKISILLQEERMPPLPSYYPCYLPTPEEIEVRKAEIQAGWDDAEVSKPWTPPVIVSPETTYRRTGHA